MVLLILGMKLLYVLFHENVVWQNAQYVVMQLKQLSEGKIKKLLRLVLSLRNFTCYAYLETKPA